MSASESRVAVIGTGGTIAHLSRGRLDLVEYADHGRIQTSAELVALVPELAGVAQVIPVDFRELSSTKITPKDWLELGRVITALEREDPSLSGIVVTHGTASLEETAYFLTLTLRTAIPVVLVGAQRPADAMGTDALINLYDAVRVAASPDARGLGVLVVMDQQIHSAREVTKSSTLRLDAFRSPEVGMLGEVGADGRIEIYRSPRRAHTVASEFDVEGLEDLPRVDITYSYAGADGTAIDAFVAAGARAIVVATMAPGKPTPDEIAAGGRARERGVVMIASSRVGSGRVPQRPLLWEQGFVAADHLNPQKARVLTALALTRWSDMSDIRRMFDRY